MLRDRECDICHEVVKTASKAATCMSCKLKLKDKSTIERETEIMQDYGYNVVGEPTRNNLGKKVYTLIAPCCGNKFQTVYVNLITGIKNGEKAGTSRLPCGTCGPKHRTVAATEAARKARA